MHLINWSSTKAMPGGVNLWRVISKQIMQWESLLIRIDITESSQDCTLQCAPNKVRPGAALRNCKESKMCISDSNKPQGWNMSVVSTAAHCSTSCCPTSRFGSVLFILLVSPFLKTKIWGFFVALQHEAASKDPINTRQDYWDVFFFIRCCNVKALFY